MTKLINKSKLTTFTNKLWDKITASFVSKTLPNNVIGETVFSDGHIEGAMLNHFNNKNPQMYIGSGTGDCFGVPNNSVNAGIYVGRIALAVNPSLVVGSSVNSVVALAVRKRNNEVMEVITQNSQAKVYNNPYRSITADKIIYIDINKKFSEEVYFVIGCNGLLWSTDTPPRANVYGSSTIPAINERLTIADYGYSGRFIIFTGKTSFEELVSLRNDSVSKTKDNIVTGKTILQDGYIDGELYSYNNPNATGVATGNGIYSGTSVRFIQSNQRVTSIVVAVNGAFEIGSKVSGVNVGVVRRDNNQIIEYVVQNGTGTVIENNYPQITATRVINIPIDKKWTEDVYLLVGANGMLWGRVQGTPGVNIATGGDRLPNVGNTISNLNTSNYIGKVVVLGSNISLNTITSKVDVSEIGNEPNKIPRVGTNGKLDPSILPAEQNGGVRTVNGQSPGSNGDVTVLAAHIKYTNGNTMNLKEAIDGKPNTVNGQRLNPSNGDIVLTGEHIKYVNGQNTTIKQAIDGKPNTVNGQGQNGGNITIYSDNIAIDSSNPNKNIKQALAEKVQTNQNNNFTKKNDFNFYAPTVTKSFTRMSFNDNDRLTNRVYNLYNDNSANYFVTLSDKFEDTGLTVSYLLLPIKNSQVGDTVSATWFVLRNNKTIHTNPGYFKNYTVEDIDMVGCKCIRIPVNVKYAEKVMFGFSVQTKSIGGRTIGMAYAEDLSYSKEVWTGRSPNSLTSFTNNSPRKVFPYKILYNTTSEVVTRFELENVAQMYPRNLIGEMKQLSYDGGEIIEENNCTWLKADGQNISQEEYPELYEKMQTEPSLISSLFGRSNAKATIPNLNSGRNDVGYYYICAKNK